MTCKFYLPITFNWNKDSRSNCHSNLKFDNFTDRKIVAIFDTPSNILLTDVSLKSARHAIALRVTLRCIGCMRICKIKYLKSR